MAQQSRRDFIVDAARWTAGIAFGASVCSAASGVTRQEPQNTIDHLGAAEVQKFVSGLKGRAITPQDSGYEAAREIWNHAFNKHPGLIIRCADAADIARSIEFGRKNDLLVAVRSGGHSLAGKSTCDKGLVIDLSDMKGVQIEPDKRVARVDAGVTIGEFDRAAQAHGLAASSGTEDSVGVSGLTLGGGFGWMMGKHGLACDSLRSATLVLADGRIVTASHTENEDLFWALRGAGANFGVVTRLEYDLHPVGTVLAGPIQYPLESLGDVLKKYRVFAPTIPDELGMTIGLIPGSDGKLIVSLAVCWCGDIQQGQKVIEPLRHFGPVLFDKIQPMSYVALQKLGSLPPNLKLSAFIRSSFLTDISDAAIDVMTAYAASAPRLSGAFVIECIHGEASRVPVKATAFPHRFAGFNFALHADWISPAGESAATAWGKSLWNAMQPHLRPAVYSNYLTNESAERVQAAYGANYEQLARLKGKYDPSNFFRLNQNILPVA